MMLSRNNAKIQQEEVEKPKVDSHMKFDYYDVNDKKAQTQNFSKGFPIQQGDDLKNHSFHNLKKSISQQQVAMELKKKKDKSQGKSFLKNSKSKSPMTMMKQRTMQKDFLKQKS